MKIRSMVVLGLLASAMLGAAPAESYKTAPKAGKKPGAPAGEEMGIIEGYEIARPSGTYLGLQVVGGNFKLSFYNAKKKPVAADVARGTARWDPKQKIGKDFCVLNPSDDGMALVGNKFVRPPYNFIVFLTLLNAAGEAVENYPVNMMAK